MTAVFPPPPAQGLELQAAQPSQDVWDFLALRRSAHKLSLIEPGPTEAELAAILQVAARVPDHKRLAPWRAIVLRGEARRKFGAAAVGIGQAERGQEHDRKHGDATTLLLRAPVIVVAVSSPDPAHEVPVWEQELSAGAFCYNLLLAASASGFGGCWLTEWMAYSPGIANLLGLKTSERVAGFIYLGSAKEPSQERMRPDMVERTEVWER